MCVRPTTQGDISFMRVVTRHADSDKIPHTYTTTTTTTIGLYVTCCTIALQRTLLFHDQCGRSSQTTPLDYKDPKRTATDMTIRSVRSVTLSPVLSNCIIYSDASASPDYIPASRTHTGGWMDEMTTDV